MKRIHLLLVPFITAILLLGCHSKGIFDNEEINPPPQPETNTLYQIAITPETAETSTPIQYEAVGYYDDGTKTIITAEVKWSSLTPDVVEFNAQGLATPIAIGSTSIVSNLDGITSNNAELNVIQPKPTFVCGHQTGLPLSKEINGGGINDKAQNNAGTNCLKVVEIIDKDDNNTTKWFTSTPSVEVLNSLGYTQDNTADNTGDTYALLAGDFNNDPNIPADNGNAPGGRFGLFRQDGKDAQFSPSQAGINGQYDRWCQKLAVLNFAGRNDWHRSTYDELNNLYSFDNALDESIYPRFGWPANKHYFSNTINYGSVFFTKALTFSSGNNPDGSAYSSVPLYVSCVSKFDESPE